MFRKRRYLEHSRSGLKFARSTTDAHWFEYGICEFLCSVFRSKKLKKDIDSHLRLWDSASTHGNNSNNMRTKTLLLSAAALAAGLVSASAQVYSVNVVGYVNVPLAEGFNLVANPLDASGGNDVTNILNKGLPAGTQVYSFNGSSYDISTYTKDKTGTSTNWSPVITLDPGLGFWVSIPSGAGAQVNTFVGEVMQGTLTNPNIPAGGGFSLVGSMVPVAGALNTDLQYNGGAGDQVYQWNGATYDISTYTKDKTGTSTNWSPSVPQVAVGEGFWLSSSAGQTWVRNFSVQ